MSKHERIEISLEALMPLFKEQLKEGKSVQFKPMGNSMLPMLRPGTDSVIVSALPQEIKKYDIVLYQRDNGQYVLHRVNVVGECYLCLGDHEFRFERVRREQMIGILTAFYRKEKKYEVKSIRYQIYCRIWPTRVRFRYYCGKIFKLGIFRRKK